MPHVSFVTLSGLRVHEDRLLSVGMTLPGLTERAEALAEIPGLGLLTLAGIAAGADGRATTARLSVIPMIWPTRCLSGGRTSSRCPP